MSKELKTRLTDQAICPHCEHKHTDHDYNVFCAYGAEFDGIMVCSSCGKKFFVSRQVQFYYTTKKIL